MTGEQVQWKLRSSSTCLLIITKPDWITTIDFLFGLIKNNFLLLSRGLIKEKHPNCLSNSQQGKSKPLQQSVQGLHPLNSIMEIKHWLCHWDHLQDNFTPQQFCHWPYDSVDSVWEIVHYGTRLGEKHDFKWKSGIFYVWNTVLLSLMIACH